MNQTGELLAVGFRSLGLGRLLRSVGRFGVVGRWVPGDQGDGEGFGTGVLLQKRNGSS